MRAQMLAFERVPAPDAVAAALKLRPGTRGTLYPAASARRPGGPVSIDDRYLPLELAAKLTVRDVETRSLLDALWHQVRLDHCDQQVEALLAAGELVGPAQRHARRGAAGAPAGLCRWRRSPGDDRPGRTPRRLGPLCRAIALQPGVEPGHEFG